MAESRSTESRSDVFDTPPAGPALTARDVLAVLFRHSGLMVLCFLAVAVVAAALLYDMPSSYQSEAKVLVKTDQDATPAFYSGMAGVREGRDSDPPSRKLETELAIFASRPLAEAVVKELGLTYDQVYRSPFTWLTDRAVQVWTRLNAGRLGDAAAEGKGAGDTVREFSRSFTVQPVRSRSAETTSNVLHITLRASDPELARRALEVLLEKYTAYAGVLNERYAEKAARAMGAGLADADAKLQQAQARLSQYMVQRGVVTGRGNAQQRFAPSMEEASAAAGGSAEGSTRALVPLVAFGDDGALLAMRSRLTQLELMLAETRATYTDKSGRVGALQAQIAALRGEIRAETRRNTENEAALMPLQRNLRMAEETYVDFKRRKSQADGFLLTSAGQSDTRVVVESPSAPGKPAESKLALGFLAGLAGLLFAAGAAGAAELSDHRLKYAWEVRRHLGMETLGTLGRFRLKGPRPLEIRNAVRNIAVKIHRRLQAKDAPPGGRAIIVTSARGGEGKTLVSMLLAQETTRLTGGRVLLVDANIENPKLHRQLGLSEAQGGFLDGLAKGGTTELIPVADGPVPGLQVMAMGWTRYSELLYRRDALAAFFVLARRQYALTIVVGPTLNAGASLVAEHTDGVVLVVDASESRREVVAGTLENVGIDPERFLGAVLNKRPMPIPGPVYRLL